MLDISIPHLEKVLKTEAQIRDFCMKHIVVTEKFDGTKLTLIRNRLPRDDRDYSRNWIVSYKGNRIFPEEFEGVTDDMLQHSVGVCQYKRVFDHLRKIDSQTDVMFGTEYFVEFIQNKPTLTRDYTQFGGLYLIDASNDVEHVESGIRTFSTPGESNSKHLDAIADFMGFKRPPVLWHGQVKSLMMFEQMCENFSDFESSLGGRAEGVVVTTDTGECYKIVAPDQYNKTVRKVKKMRYALEEPEETHYWEAVRNQAFTIVKGSGDRFTSIEESLKNISKEVYSLEREHLSGENTKKHHVVKCDDLMLTSKLVLEETNELLNAKSVGVIPLAGKPVHSGHWCLIEKALQHSDVVYLFVSLKDRGEGSGRINSGKMLKVWKDLLFPVLDPRVIVRFCDSPVLDANRFVRSSSESWPGMKYTFWGDTADVEERWSHAKLEKTFADLLNAKRVEAIGLNRSDTVHISGTEMRKWLEERERDKFVMNLPQVLTYTQRVLYYEILRDRPSELMTCPY